MTESILAAGESPAGAIVAAGRRGRRCLEVHVRRGGSRDGHGCRAEGERAGHRAYGYDWGRKQEMKHRPAPI